MDYREKAMKQMLEQAKTELERKQKSIQWSTNNDIGFSCFEKNMVSDLIQVIELKEKIRTLELCLQLKM